MFWEIMCSGDNMLNKMPVIGLMADNGHLFVMNCMISETANCLCCPADAVHFPELMVNLVYREKEGDRMIL